MNLEYKLIVKYRHKSKWKIRRYLISTKFKGKIVYSWVLQMAAHCIAKLRGVAFPNFKPPKVQIKTKLNNGVGIIELFTNDKDVIIVELFHLMRAIEKGKFKKEGASIEWQTFKLNRKSRWIPFKC